MYPIPTLGPQIWSQAPGPCGSSFREPLLQRKNGDPHAQVGQRGEEGKNAPGVMWVWENRVGEV